MKVMVDCSALAMIFHSGFTFCQPKSKLIHFTHVRKKPDSRPKPKEDRDLTLGIGRKDCNQPSIKKRGREMSVEKLLQAVGTSPIYEADTPWLTIPNTVWFQSW